MLLLIMQSKLTHPYIQDLRNNYLALIASIHGKQTIVHLCVVLGMSLTAHSLRAESPGDNSSSIAQREIARRANLVVEADKALGLGRAAYASNEYEEAVKQYRSALSMLPPGPALADRRETYTSHLGDASAALAQEYRRIGRYDEARDMLEGVISQDPTNLAAKKQLGYLDDPIRTNPALTYDHAQNVDQVRRHLYTGEGYYSLGKYSEANAEFKKILQIDPYNKAARRWLERIATTKSDYYRAAYDQTRAELLMEVDRAWESSVPPELPDFGPGEGSSLRTSGVEYIQQKLNNIMIPKVDFEDVTVKECLETLRLRAREFDFEQDDEKKGINFLIRDPSMQAASPGELEADADFGAGAIADSGSSIGARKVDELRLTRVPLGAVLEYICDKTRLRYKIDKHAVILLPIASLEIDDLYTRTFTVPPDFISRLSQDGGSGGGGNDDPFGDDDGGASALGERANAKTLLQESGVSFPGESFANYIASTSTLVVHNTLTNLDIIDEIIAVLRKAGPRQVRIMTKFIEVSQDNTDELGFDWIVSPFDLGGNGSNGIISGGTIGNGVPRTINDLGNPNLLPGATSVSNIATAGLRSGDYANTRNSIDSIINNPSRSSQATNVAPGILSITGLFDNGQAQMIMRGLSQKKGADVMTAPSILAKSGESATIEVIREFIYPTEYEPPELPQSVGTTGTTSDGGGGGGGASAEIFPVTPATPTGFETRNTGVTLEIEPTIGENNYSIDLRFAPELVEFEGFINYGSPIQTLGTDILGNPISITITENRIEMPVFATRRVTTGLTIYDGYTVAVGGLMREDVQNVEDSVPILGDLPIIGRLFRSKAESRIKSNLIIFVTAEIIDAAGSRINQSTSSSPGAGGAAPQSVMPLDGGDGLLPSR